MLPLTPRPLVRMSGVEPESPAWQAGMLPLAPHPQVGKGGIAPPPESYKGSALLLRHMPWWGRVELNHRWRFWRPPVYRWLTTPGRQGRS